MISPTARQFLDDVGVAGLVRELKTAQHHDAQRHAPWPADKVFGVTFSACDENGLSPVLVSAPWPVDRGLRLFRVVVATETTAATTTIEVNSANLGNLVTLSLATDQTYGEVDFAATLQSRDILTIECPSIDGRAMGGIVWGWCPSGWIPSGGLMMGRLPDG